MTSAPRRSAEGARAALAAALMGLAAGPAWGQARLSAGVDWLVQGLFCAPPEGGRREAPGTMSGWVHVPDQPVQMVAEGTVAPAILGLGFGVRFQRAGTGDAPIRYVVTHPPMSAAGITRQTWDAISVGGETDAVFFQFDIPDELVPGDWAFQAFVDGQEVFHAPFTVVPGDRMPEVAALCQPGTLLSALGP